MNSPDFSEHQKLAARLIKATQRLGELAPQVGGAKAVKEFASDQRKNLLARYMVKHLKGGESAAAAECYARADEGFGRDLGALMEGFEAAEKVIATYNAEDAAFNATRSLLSMQREVMRNLEG